MKIFVFCSLAILTLPVSAADSPQAVFPLERSAYFIGETIPLSVPSGQKVEIVDSANRIAATGNSGVSRLNTDGLAPGTYQVRVDGTSVGNFSLTGTVRRSPGTMSDSVNNSLTQFRQRAVETVAAVQKNRDNLQKLKVAAEARLAKANETQRTAEQSAVDQATANVNKADEQLVAAKTKLAGVQEGTQVPQQLRESGLGAFTLVGTDQGPIFDRFLDTTAPMQVMNYVNPYGRAGSFFGARVFAPEMDGMVERMLHIAQSNLRYPNFGGFIYHWDALGFDRSPRSYYWIIDRHVKPGFLDYTAQSEDALRQQFRERTGLVAPNKLDYIHHAMILRDPDLGPAFDLPTRQWIAALVEKAPAPSAEEVKQLEARLDGWSRYLMEVMPEASATFQKHLRELEPGLKNSASHDNQFLPREGNWPTSAYVPLDFRWVEAWSDQHDGGSNDYVYQWLFHAALADADNPARQPIWVASILNGAHDNFAYPGRFARVAAQILAYDGRGLGLAKEGFTNLFGGLYAETNWEKNADQSTRFDWELGRDFLWRFAPLQEQSESVRPVGILISEGQFALQQPGLGLGGSPHFEMMVYLARLGYTPRFVTERMIEQGGLKGFSELVILNHFAPFPEKVKAGFAEFAQDGGKLFLTKNSTVVLEGAQPLDLELPFKWPGRVYNIPAANFVGNDRGPQRLEKKVNQYGPILRKALGEKSRALLLPEAEEAALVSAFSLGGGADAQYVVVTNDSIYAKSGSWARQDVKLRLNAAAGAERFTALYELTEEKALGAVQSIAAPFQDTPVRVYGLLTRPVAAVDLTATQKVKAGEKLQLAVSFLDGKKQRLNAAIPLHLEVKDSTGQIVGAFDRSTGTNGEFAMEFPVGGNATLGKWSVSARSCLDGTTVTIPVEITAGRPQELLTVKEVVIARNGGAIQKLWKTKPALVAPIFEGPQKATRLAAAEAARQALAPLGVKLEIREHPAISPYVIAWKLTPDQAEHNRLVEQGEAIGKRLLSTGRHVDHYFSAITAYAFPQSLLLIEVPGEAVDPISAHLARNGFLWPTVSEAFPGQGKAVVQLVSSAFKLGVDSVVVQATDAAGLLAGAKALANPPEDWITPGVAAARLKLQHQMSIDRTSAQAAGTELAAAMAPGTLTAKGAVMGVNPQALRLPEKTVAGKQLLPPTREVATAPQPKISPTARPVPADFLLKAGVFLPYYRPLGEWTPASEGKTNGDLRFSESHQGRIKVETAGKYRIRMQGLFRFSDRRPATQPSWVDYVNEYMAQVQPTRKPMTFEVRLDGKSLGRLTETTVETKDAEVSFAFGRALKLPEELVTEVSGVVELPVGEHDLMLAHENVVDGKLTSVSIQLEAKP